MAESDQQEKTEPATPKRLADSREEGKVAKSQEVGSVAILMGGVLVFYFTSSYMLAGMGELMKGSFRELHLVEFDRASITALIYGTLWQAIYILGPFFLAAVFIALSANIAQVGFLIAPKALKPKFSALNPKQGLKKIFSSRGVMELAKSLLKIAVVGWVAWWTIREEFPHTLDLVHQSPRQILEFWGRVAFKIFLRTGLVWVFLAIMDYSYQKWKMAKDMRMTKQQVKDENKQREGDPQVKARIRGIQREQAKRRMMAAVPEADVVIVNPTHYAVALAYRHEKMDAPKVVAKGADHLAHRIQVIAREHDVPVLQNRALARTLYDSAELNQYIPAELYQAVAEVLAVVYRLDGRESAWAETPSGGGQRQ